MKPSKLWRRLGIAQPAFRVWVTPLGTAEMDDSDIVSMTLTHGDGSVVGIAKNTASIRLAGARPPLDFDASTLHVDLTEAATTAVLAKCGGWNGSSWNTSVQQRWRGRVAGQSVTDTGDRHERQWLTDMTCTDNWPLISAIGAGAHVTRTSHKVSDLVTAMIASSAVYFPGPLKPLGFAEYRVLYGDNDPDTKTFNVSDVEQHWITDLGQLLRTDRAGIPQLVGVDYRQFAAEHWSETAPFPITRATAIAPVTWEQRNSLPYGVHYDLSDGTGVDIWVSSNNPSVGKWPTETLDMKDVQLNPAIPISDPMTARVARSARSGYAVNTLKFDLLDLLNRPAMDERRLAMLLLTSEPGDPIIIAPDWPGDIAGAHTITRAEESISATEWTIDLDLAPLGWATGTTPPQPRFTAWNYAYRRGTTWDEITNTEWDEAP